MPVPGDDLFRVTRNGLHASCQEHDEHDDQDDNEDLFNSHAATLALEVGCDPTITAWR